MCTMEAQSLIFMYPIHLEATGLGFNFSLEVTDGNPDTDAAT